MGSLITFNHRRAAATRCVVRGETRRALSRSAFVARLLAWLVVVLCSGVAVRAQGSREYDLKAIFVYNLANFVEWPGTVFEDLESPFVIGVLGDDPFGRALDNIVENEYVGKHPFVIQRFRRVEEITTCHVLFISRSETRRLREIFSQLRGRPILTVGDLPDFVQAGGMIGFGTRDNHLELFVNPQALRAVQLNVSSKLLELAHIVDAFAASP